MFKSKPYLHLHFLVFLWGFTAILGLLITLSFPELVFYRTLFSFLSIAPILFISKVSYKVKPKVCLKLLITGAIISLHWLLFFGAARYANASVSLIGIATTSLWTSLLEPLVKKTRIKKSNILFGLIILLTVYYIYEDSFSYGLGLLMSIGSAFLAAFFSTANSIFIKKNSALQITFYEALGAFIASIPFFIWQLEASDFSLTMPSKTDLFYLLFLSLVCTTYANIAWVKILKKTSAFASNLVINLEPVYGIILALLIFGSSEKMNSSFYWGGALIIITVFSYPFIIKKIEKK